MNRVATALSLAMPIFALEAETSSQFEVNTRCDTSSQVVWNIANSIGTSESCQFEVATRMDPIHGGHTGDTDPVVVDGMASAVGCVGESFPVNTIIAAAHEPACTVPLPMGVQSVAFVCDTGGWLIDSDGDGLPEWWEARYEVSGSKLKLLPTVDDDMDGMDNYAEFVANTNPLDASSRFEILGIWPDDFGKGFQFKWMGANGRRYTIWQCDALGLEWREIGNVAGADGVQAYSVGIERGGTALYKIGVEIDANQDSSSL